MTFGTTLGFIQNIGMWQWLLLLLIGLLIYGRRLPEVGRSLGRSVVEFKKGLRGIEDELEDASREASRPTASSSTPAPLPPREAAAAPTALPREAAPASAESGPRPADYRVSRSDTVE